MEQLPTDIAKKLENLPIVSFNNANELQNVIMSQDFIDILAYYEEHYMPDEFKKQQEIQKRIALYLTLTNQDSDLTDQIDNLLYRRPMPSIEEFLSGKFYMYNSNATLYPYWRQQLEYMFREGSPVRKTIFGGSIGCLTGDTIVATLNGNKTIYELLNDYDNEWVLSFNTFNKTWEPDKIINVFCSGIKDVYKITLDNNEVIKCTSDHRFLTRKNKWKSIDTGLESGESMMPYYSKISDKGYIQIKNNITEKWEKRYQIVGKWKTLYKTGQVVHHKNFNKLDDRPQNLAIIPHKYHWEYHAKIGGRRWKEYNASIRGDEFKEYRRQKGIKSHITYKARLDYEEIEIKRKIGWNKLHQDSEHQRKASLAGWNGPHGEEYRQRASKTLIERNKTEKARNISKKMAENMRNLKANKSPEEKAIILAKQVLAVIARFHGKENQKYIELLAFIHTKEPWYNPTLGAKENYKRKKIYNHKIISIEYIGKQQVYDITTEKNHNFALKAGIIAHNCGKSTIARKAFLYVLYRILCLRYPRAVFNIDSDATIANVIISMTLKQVYETNLLPFVKLMETMPCFQRVMRMQSFENFDLSDPHCPIPFNVEKSTGTIYFPDNIILTSGSGITHTIGLNIVNSFCFTGNMKVYTDKGIVTFMSLYRQFKDGIKFSTYSVDNNGNKEKTEIIDVKITGYKQDLIRIYYDDIRYVECTPEHPFIILNPKKDDKNIIYENNIPYKQAQYLTEEDEIYSDNNAFVYALIDNRPYSDNYNKPFYIGISSHNNQLSNLNHIKYARPYYHFTNKCIKTCNNPLKNTIILDILNNNFQPKIKILQENITLEEAFNIEKQLIQQFGKKCDKNGILTNISDGGEGTILTTIEIIKKKSEKIRETKRKIKEEKLKQQLIYYQNLFSDIKFVFALIIICSIRNLEIHSNYKKAANRPDRINLSRLHIIEYNKSEEHRKKTAYYNSIKPKVSSLESKAKLAKTQSETWNKKSEAEKIRDNLSKSLGRAWNVLNRIEDNYVNEQIFNAHRSKRSRLANTEPLWKSIIQKAGNIETFLFLIKEKYGREFIYED